MARVLSLLHFKLRLVVALLLLFFVLYVGLGRLALSFLPHFHSEIEQTLTRTLDRTVTVSRFEGSWHRFDPEIIVHGVSLIDSQGETQASVSEIVVRLDFFETFLARDLRFKAIIIDQASFFTNKKCYVMKIIR